MSGTGRGPRPLRVSGGVGSPTDEERGLLESEYETEDYDWDAAQRELMNPSQLSHDRQQPPLPLRRRPAHGAPRKHAPYTVPRVATKRQAVKRMRAPRLAATDDVDVRRVSAHCIADVIQWPDIPSIIQLLSHTSTVINEDVVHVKASAWPEAADAFLFVTYGAIVFWDLPERAENQFLTLLKSYIDDDDLLEEREESDSFDWCYATTSMLEIHANKFFIPVSENIVDDVQVRLAASYAFVTSVKLDTFEVGIEKTIEETQGIPQELATEGKISLSKEEVSRHIGELFMQKAAVNLIHDILDTPDHFWDSQFLEAVYVKCRKFLSIDQRVDVINKRLDVLAELLDILRTEKSEQHSARLEWIVIILIVVEILLGLVDIFYNVFWGGNTSPF
eukprot:m.169540 g.169540  ORF g.169540 m.169540 type:complete len:391 (+) comp14497_c3_seq1:482-1654(+)